MTVYVLVQYFDYVKTRVLGVYSSVEDAYRGERKHAKKNPYACGNYHVLEMQLGELKGDD